MRSSLVAACLAIAATAGEPPADVPEGFVVMPTAEQSAFFESSIRPLLITRCLGCHSSEVDDPGGGLLLDSRRGLIVGGDTGPAVIAGKPAASLLIRAVRRDDSRLRMPPDEALPPEEIHLLERWVEMGLPDPRSDDTVAAHRDRTAIDWEAARDFWSLRPIEAVEPPPATCSRRPRPPSAIGSSSPPATSPTPGGSAPESTTIRGISRSKTRSTTSAAPSSRRRSAARGVMTTNSTPSRWATITGSTACFRARGIPAGDRTRPTAA